MRRNGAGVAWRGAVIASPGVHIHGPSYFFLPSPVPAMLLHAAAAAAPYPPLAAAAAHPPLPLLPPPAPPGPRFRPYASATHHVTKGRYITSNDVRGYMCVVFRPLCDLQAPAADGGV